MNYENFKQGFDKPSIFTAQQYGTKVSVEVDHSDMDLDEVMDAFQTLLIGMGYHENSIKNWVIDRAEEYIETDAENLKEKLEEYTLEDFKREEAEFENNFFGDWDERRMDVIGQNGNEGLHYRATEEDEDEFSNEDYEGQFEDWKNETPDENEFDDYGQRIEKDRVGFEWGDEPEDDNLFEGDEWEANDELKTANERYKKALKTLSAKQKKKSK
jgi:hypothetical protein